MLKELPDLVSTCVAVIRSTEVHKCNNLSVASIAWRLLKKVNELLFLPDLNDCKQNAVYHRMFYFNCDYTNHTFLFACFK